MTFKLNGIHILSDNADSDNSSGGWNSRQVRKVAKTEKKRSAPPKKKRIRADPSSRAIGKDQKQKSNQRNKSFCSGGKQTSTAKNLKRKGRIWARNNKCQ
jgi:hypothetical protein